MSKDLLHPVKRNASITVKFSNKEKVAIQEYCTAHHLVMSDLMRHAVMKIVNK